MKAYDGYQYLAQSVSHGSMSCGSPTAASTTLRCVVANVCTSLTSCIRRSLESRIEKPSRDNRATGSGLTGRGRSGGGGVAQEPDPGFTSGEQGIGQLLLLMGPFDLGET